jgi:hypothetical protein
MNGGNEFPDARVADFIHDALDTFPKRDLVELYAAHPEASFALPELEARLKTDRFILLRQCRELAEVGLLSYRYADAHTRVWELAPTEWARQMTRAVVNHWQQHPEKRHRIVHHGRSAKNRP